MRLYFPELEPCVAQSASLPAVHPVYLCANVGPRGATHCSACPALRHSESSPLGLSVRECGAAASASARTACPGRPTLRQSQSRHGHVSPLHSGAVSAPPTGLDECLFCIFLVLDPLAVRFSVSSGCARDPLAVRFSVSSGCARRRSVSTYAAILVLHEPSFEVYLSVQKHPNK